MLSAALEALGLDPAACRCTPVHGGSIHRAFRVERDGGEPLFVKVNDRPPPGIFACEARGLAVLREAVDAAGVLGVPRVEAVGEGFLALQWIDLSGGGSAAGERLGRGVAALHGVSADAFGWPEDNWIGALPQPNTGVAPEVDAAGFFATHRLRAQARLGAGRLGAGLLRRLDVLCDRLPDLLPLDEPPALLHGDLWGGNWGADPAGRPWIFDPAVHFGCREAEIAFTRLFGGFPAEFEAAYRAAFPLAPGFEDRVDLWNLYPLLVHANLFGGGYAGQVDGILRRYVGATQGRPRRA